MDDKNREIMISIKDEGLGIPYDRQDKIFERFYRSDRARTRKLGGSGLGLAITKELVEAHYGRIRSEEHTSELQSRGHLVCRLLLEKKKKMITYDITIR